MKSSSIVSQLKEAGSRRLFLYSIFPAAALFLVVLFIGSTFIGQHPKERLLLQIDSTWKEEDNSTRLKSKIEDNSTTPKLEGAPQSSPVSTCEDRCRTPGSEPLPKGIVAETSNLERRPLWGSPKPNNASKSLFAAAVGVKQKERVDKMVQKFLSSNFSVMLFHYDAIVDGWQDVEWSNNVIHISALNQTKWWFAKRFLHPNIVAEYSYIFLWDEDLGVENFNPERYLSIVKDEGLEISQPALDVGKSEVHHQITARGRKARMHRRTYRAGNDGSRCDKNSTAPPCTGWIEVMAPVFSRAAWRCVWYMIQNDLIHAWGLDMKLGYCAQGDRTKNIGVVDAEYIVHYGLPTLGDPEKKEQSGSKTLNYRVEVRRQSYNEFKEFERRWRKAVEEDKCWKDPYP